MIAASGILLLDKPLGWTSHDVVAFVRRILAIRRVGHGGTLDPLASGLLVVLYGQATKVAEAVHRAPKAYLAEIALGHETATDDREGQPTHTAPVPALDDARLRQSLAGFVGVREQVPPAYSAIHVGGQRAYARARRGEDVTLPARRIEIFGLDLLERRPDGFEMLVTASAGTYIRALARDLGRALGTRAHLEGLRRLASGGFFVDDALAPADIERHAAAGTLGPLVRHPKEIAAALTGPALAGEAARRLLAGKGRTHSLSGGERS